MEGQMKRLPKILALVTGSLFVYAGMIKLDDLNGFMRDVYGFRLLPWNVSVAVALYVPWLEIICGVGLQWRPLRRGALAIVSFMVVSFLGAVISALMRGLDIGCGCFGKASEGSLWGTLVIDLVLLAGLGWLWWLLAPCRMDSEKPFPHGQGTDLRPGS